jgi:hypothetical protein
MAENSVQKTRDLSAFYRCDRLSKIFNNSALQHAALRVGLLAHCAGLLHAVLRVGLLAHCAGLLHAVLRVGLLAHCAGLLHTVLRVGMGEMPYNLFLLIKAAEYGSCF